MTGPQRPIPVRGDDEDVQGHVKRRADAESAEGDDTEGHIYIEDRQDGQRLR